METSFCGMTFKQIVLLKQFFEQTTGKASHTICEADLVFAPKSISKEPEFDLMPLYAIGELNPIGYVKVPRA